jgi:DNA-binding transcriptional MerR regulator
MAKDISKKLYYDISEVSKITDVKPYVLRYWETEFPSLKPLKTAKGQRKYKQKDIGQILQIKQLLHTESYTIAGARKKIGKEEIGETHKKDIVSLLEYTKEELRKLVDLLDKPVQ